MAEVANGAAGAEPKDLVIEENADGTAVVVDPNAQPAVVEHEEDDHPTGERTARGAADEDDGPTEAEELAQAADDAAREAIRARRRAERKDRKRKASEREENLRRKLLDTEEANRQLNERISLIERRTNGQELAQLDGAIQEAEHAAQVFEREIAAATNRSDGKGVAEATVKMIRAGDRAKELKAVRAAYRAPQEQGATRPPQPTYAPIVAVKANEWAAKNNWYSPNGKDIDSKIARELDNAVAADGYDPKTQEYWEEFDSRIRKYLPHRAGSKDVIVPSDTARNKPGRSVVTGSSRESASTGGAQFVLSADRVKALKDAGMWDDPKARAAMIKDYIAYDARAVDAKSKT